MTNAAFIRGFNIITLPTVLYVFINYYRLARALAAISNHRMFFYIQKEYSIFNVGMVLI